MIQSQHPKLPMPTTREGFEIILAILNDVRELIAAGKVQRWDVLKWAVTVNIALAAAFAGFRHRDAGPAFFFSGLIVAAFGLGLIYHYNRRITKTRERLRQIHTYIRENIIDLKEATGLEYGMTKSTFYDKEELYLYSYIICFSLVPIIFVWAFA